MSTVRELRRERDDGETNPANAAAPVPAGTASAAPAGAAAAMPGGTTAATPAGASPLARVNGQPLHEAGVVLAAEELRQRACTELLRQAAQRAGLLDAGDAAGTDGAISEAAASAIEALLEQELRVPEPSEEACRRYYDANPARYGSGERVRARHVLFAVTPGVDVNALLPRAEHLLLELRCGDGHGGERPDGDEQGNDAQEGDVQDDAFAAAARTWSNCPSGALGGMLGWLRAADCAPEFAREVFGQPGVGVLPRLVRSRFGLHVVEVLEREPALPPPYETVRGAVALALRQQAWITALRQYVRLLAGRAEIEGVDLEAADTPLVQ